jgi:DNA polymerase III delta prime subunit
MNELQFPPPHMLFHEPMEDREMIRTWKAYTAKYSAELDTCEIDAADVCSVEEFGRIFEIWVTSKSSKRIKLLMVWHAHFLSLACQQALRRWLETKSYRARVWFHAEYVNNIQSAIQSRCILKRLVTPPSDLITPTCEGKTDEMISLWKRIVSQESYTTLT